MHELHALTLADAAALIEARRLSPVELVQALLSRIEDFDPQVNAFITVTADLALEQARQAECEISAGRYRGPLHGIPLGIKDIYNTAGVRTTANSRLCLDNVPSEDAAAVAKLKRAGAVLMGKLATHEFAHGGPSFDLPWPPARNPWNLECFTGGSSSGPAAAVAAGFVLGALGSDTGGSIRGPASYCGINGLMPTTGLVSRHGVIPNSFTLDRCGPMAWTVKDCALLLQVIAGFDSQDAASVERPIPDYRAALDGDIRGLKIGVVRHFWEDELPAAEEHRQALEQAISVLKSLGAKLADCRMRPLQDYRDVKTIIGESELFAIHRKDLSERAGEYGADFLGRTLPACLFQAGEYVQATRWQHRMQLEMVPLYETHDALLTAAMGPAPLLAPSRAIEFWRKPNITTPFNVTGGPVLASCIGYSSDGLPMGMQIAGRPFAEMTILRIGHAYEQATPWRARKPAIAKRVVCKPPAAPAPAVVDVDPHARALAEALAHQAQLDLDQDRLAQLLEATPYVLEIKKRVAFTLERHAAPATAFHARH